MSAERAVNGQGTGTCDACERAEQSVTSGLMRAGCEGCIARELARSPAFFASVRAGAMTPAYRAALKRVFPEREAEGHAAAKAWAARTGIHDAGVSRHTPTRSKPVAGVSLRGAGSPLAGQVAA